MSSYFDAKAQELRDMRAAGLSIHHAEVRQWIRMFVLDIAVACEFDRSGPLAFPEELRDAAYKLVLRCSPEHWPYGVPGYGVDYETDEQGLEYFRQMVEGMHDIFHESARRGWRGGDNPLSATQAMDSRMEERCAELIAADPSLTLPPLPPLSDNTEELP